jgi:hypothetical protein
MLLTLWRALAFNHETTSSGSRMVVFSAFDRFKIASCSGLNGFRKYAQAPRIVCDCWPQVRQIRSAPAFPQRAPTLFSFHFAIAPSA